MLYIPSPHLLGKYITLVCPTINEVFLMSPQGLYYLQLKIIYMPKWHFLGRPVPKPYKEIHNTRKYKLKSNQKPLITPLAKSKKLII